MKILGLPETHPQSLERRNWLDCLLVPLSLWMRLMGLLIESSFELLLVFLLLEFCFGDSAN